MGSKDSFYTAKESFSSILGELEDCCQQLEACADTCVDLASSALHRPRAAGCCRRDKVVASAFGLPTVSENTSSGRLSTTCLADALQLSAQSNPLPEFLAPTDEFFPLMPPSPAYSESQDANRHYSHSNSEQVFPCPISINITPSPEQTTTTQIDGIQTSDSTCSTGKTLQSSQSCVPPSARRKQTAESRRSQPQNTKKPIVVLDLQRLHQAIEQQKDRATTMTSVDGTRLRPTALYTSNTTSAYCAVKIQGLPSLSAADFQRITSQLSSSIETALSCSLPCTRIPTHTYQRGCILVGIALVGIMSGVVILRNRHSDQTASISKDSHNHTNSDGCESEAVVRHLKGLLHGATSSALNDARNCREATISVAVHEQHLFGGSPQVQSGLMQIAPIRSAESSAPQGSAPYVTAALNLMSRNTVEQLHSAVQARGDWHSTPNAEGSVTPTRLPTSSAISAPFTTRSASMDNEHIPNTEISASPRASGIAGTTRVHSSPSILDNVDAVGIDGLQELVKSLTTHEHAVVALPGSQQLQPGKLLLWPEQPYVVLPESEITTPAARTETVTLTLLLSSVDYLRGKTPAWPAVHSSFSSRQSSSLGVSTTTVSVIAMQGSRVICRQELQLFNNDFKECSINLPMVASNLRTGCLTVLVLEELKPSRTSHASDAAYTLGHGIHQAAHNVNMLAACNVVCFSSKTCAELQTLWVDMQSEVADQWCTDIHDMPPPQRLLSALAWCHSYAPFLSDIQLLIEGPAMTSTVPDLEEEKKTYLETGSQNQHVDEWWQAMYNLLAFMSTRNMQATTAEVLAASRVQIHHEGSALLHLPIEKWLLNDCRQNTAVPQSDCIAAQFEGLLTKQTGKAQAGGDEGTSHPVPGSERIIAQLEGMFVRRGAKAQGGVVEDTSHIVTQAESSTDKAASGTDGITVQHKAVVSSKHKFSISQPTDAVNNGRKMNKLQLNDGVSSPKGAWDDTATMADMIQTRATLTPASHMLNKDRPSTDQLMHICRQSSSSPPTDLSCPLTPGASQLSNSPKPSRSLRRALTSLFACMAEPQVRM